MHRRRNLFKTGLLFFYLIGLNVYPALAEVIPQNTPPDIFSLYDYLANSPLLGSSRTNIEKELASNALYDKQHGPTVTVHADNNSYGAKLYDIKEGPGKHGNEQNFRFSPSVVFTPSTASGLSLTYGYNYSKSYDDYASLDTQTHSFGLNFAIDTFVKRDYLNDLKTLELSLKEAKLNHKQQLDQFYLTMLALITSYYQTEYNLTANTYQLAIEVQEKNKLQIQVGTRSTSYLKELNTIDQLKQQINLNNQVLAMLESKARIYMGFNPTEIHFDIDNILTRLKAQPLPLLTFDQFKEAAGQQPGIIQLDDAIIKKDIEINRVNQALMPSIDFQASYAYNNRTQNGMLALGETTNQPTSSTNNFSLSLGVSVPVDKYITNQSELNVKNLEKKQLLEQKSEKLISLYYDYQKSLQDYNAALTDLTSLQAAQPVLQQDINEKEQLYAKNLVAAFDLQQAKDELTSNKKQLNWKVITLFNSYENNVLAYRGYLKEEK